MSDFKIEEEVAKEAFDAIFKKYAELTKTYSEEYGPKPVTAAKTDSPPPPYKPIPKSYGLSH